MKAVAEDLLASGERERTLDWNELNAEKYPFTARTWKGSGMTWHFVNRKISRPTGEKLAADKVADVLSQIL